MAALSVSNNSGDSSARPPGSVELFYIPHSGPAPRRATGTLPDVQGDKFEAKIDKPGAKPGGVAPLPYQSSPPPQQEPQPAPPARAPSAFASAAASASPPPFNPVLIGLPADAGPTRDSPSACLQNEHWCNGVGGTAADALIFLAHGPRTTALVKNLVWNASVSAGVSAVMGRCSDKVGALLQDVGFGLRLLNNPVGTGFILAGCVAHEIAYRNSPGYAAFCNSNPRFMAGAGILLGACSRLPALSGSTQYAWMWKKDCPPPEPSAVDSPDLELGLGSSTGMAQSVGDSGGGASSAAAASSTAPSGTAGSPGRIHIAGDSLQLLGTISPDPVLN